MMIQDILARGQKRDEVDAQRFETREPDLCMLCHARGEDKRNLFISCFYDVSEAIPEAVSLRQCSVEEWRGRGWYLRICKSCRAALLALLAAWQAERVSLRGIPKDHDGGLLEECGAAYIPVRQHGALTMMTLAEWEEYKAGQKWGAGEDDGAD